jgi:hypothetical protein
VSAYVWNNAPAGSNSLNYSISYANFAGTSTASNSSISANGGLAGDLWNIPFNSAGAAFGTTNVITTVADPNASNSPQISQTAITVLDHARPDFFLNWANQVVAIIGNAPQPIVDNVIVQQPDLNPEQQAAGGDHIAIATPGVIGDPLVPPAGLALNYVDSIGDPLITTDLTPFANLPADDNPADADRFHVYLRGCPERISWISRVSR